MTDILTLAKENGFSHIGFADMSALTPLTAGCCTICAKCTYPDKPAAIRQSAFRRWRLLAFS